MPAEEPMQRGYYWLKDDGTGEWFIGCRNREGADYYKVAATACWEVVGDDRPMEWLKLNCPSYQYIGLDPGHVPYKYKMAHSSNSNRIKKLTAQQRDVADVLLEAARLIETREGGRFEELLLEKIKTQLGIIAPHLSGTK